MNPCIAGWAPSPFDHHDDWHPEARMTGVFGLGGAAVANHVSRLEHAR